jgi:hypothetical protein
MLAHANQMLSLLGTSARTNPAAPAELVPYGAVGATIYYPDQLGTTWDPAAATTPIECDASAIEGAYGYLVDQGVSAVSESYACGFESDGTTPLAPADGLAEDYFARHFGVLPVRSSGNSGSNAATCPAPNSLCVGGSQCGSSALYDHEGYRNPATPSSSTDREEPDVVELALAVDAPDFEFLHSPTSSPDGTHFMALDGTSAAAPITAVLAANLEQACGHALLPTEISAILRTAAWRNPDAAPYSTPGFQYGDRKDGAGSPSAEAIALFCQPSLAEGFGDIATSVHTQWGSIPVDFSGVSIVPGKIDQPITGFGPGPLGGGSPAGRIGAPFLDVDLAAGDRVRATLSWEACSAMQEGTDPTEVTTDFDLFLCVDPGIGCVATSASFFDNNEGFDVTIEAAGHYQHWWTAAVPTEHTSALPDTCNGDTKETFSFAAAWGPGADLTGYQESCTYP